MATASAVKTRASKLMRRALGVAGALLLGAVGPVAAAPTAQQKCEAAKNKAAGLYAGCRQKAEKGRALTGDLTKYGEAIFKCEDKFESLWQKAIESAAAKGETCADAPLTAVAFKALIDGHSANVATALAGGGLTPCFQIAPCTAGDHPTLNLPTTRYRLHPVTGHCYVAVSVPFDWFTADDVCGMAGGELAVPSDLAENDDFIAQVRGSTALTWIGINDAAQEGVFVSVTGESFTTQWTGGEPNNAGNEDCAAMGTATTWLDLNCASTVPQFVCEFEP